MVNYKNSSIYKLCCKDTDIKDIYVGSTTNFKRRKGDHKYNCNNEKSLKHNIYVYQFIRENGGWTNWDMVEICNFSCDNKRELHTEERRHLELLGATLNKLIPTRTLKEYYEDNKEEIQEYHKEYYKDNKDKIIEKSKEYYEENKEIIAEKMKMYAEKNKEHIKNYQKEYRENNKEILAIQKKEYSKKNKEQLKKYRHEWYLKNKERKEKSNDL